MDSLLRISLIIFYLKWCRCQKLENNEEEIFCRESNTAIGVEKQDLFQIIEVFSSQNVVLKCHYCKEVDDQQPKIWFKSYTLEHFPKNEIKLDKNNNQNLSRIYVNTEHSLILRNVTSEDSSFYLCQPYQGEEIEKEINFFVDVVDVNETTIESGNITNWSKYQKENFFPINQLFSRGNGPEYIRLRDILKLNLEIITTWDTWSDCEVCGRPLGDGIRKKKGHCRIKIRQVNSTNDTNGFTREEINFIRATEIGCRSIVLKNFMPGIFNLTKIVPDFIQIDSCTGTCNPDSEGKFKGWKSTKKTGYKYRKTIVLTENAHLTLVCPESTLENVVIWKRNGKTLSAGESIESLELGMEPKITVDTFNTLYLHEVTKNEEGNYTCHVDNIRMQQTIIYVVSKSRLLTQALLRHMMYLGFILSLTLSCYAAGLIITWTRRYKFKTYEEIKKLRKNNSLSSDSEDENVDNEDTSDTRILITSSER